MAEADEILNLAAAVLGGISDYEGLPEDGKIARGPRATPGGRRGRAAARRLMPLRLGRYVRHLVAVMPAAGVAPGLRDAVPLALALAVNLLEDGDPGDARHAWKRLVDRAGLKDAEWFMVELLTATDLVPVGAFTRVAMAWGQATWGQATSNAVAGEGVPACMAADHPTAEPVRADPTKVARLAAIRAVARSRGRNDDGD